MVYWWAIKSNQVKTVCVIIFMCNTRNILFRFAYAKGINEKKIFWYRNMF